MRYFTRVGWLNDWKRKRVLARHRIDDALWRGAAGAWPFIASLAGAEARKLKDLAVLFLAEKELAGAHGFELTRAMPVSIAAQACLPILELGLGWYGGWHG